MKRNLFRNISKVLMTIMLSLCMLFIMCACQSKKELSLNNYQKYVRVEYDLTSEQENGNLIIVETIVIQKVNIEDKLFDVTIKCSYQTNDDEGEFSENLGDLISTYTKVINIDDNTWGEGSSHGGHVTVLEISGTAQRTINVDKMAPILLPSSLTIIVFVILGIFVAHGLKFSANFDKIQTGMSYNQVVEILGEPNSISKVDNILTCVWKKHILRGWIIVRAVTLENDIVISKTN